MKTPPTKKLGRPATDEDREKLTLMNFKADAETKAAVAKLERALRANYGAGRMVKCRSEAIRRALIEAAERIK